MDYLQKLKKLAKDSTLLIVDDEKEITKYLKELFSLFFKEVKTKNSPIEALDIYNQNSFDIVLTDLTMPQMDGIELIKEIKNINQKQRILILSAHNNPTYLLEAINLDVDGYLLKPLNKDRLIQIMIKTLSSIKAEKIMQEYQKELEKKLQEKEEELKNIYLKDSITNLPNKIALIEDIQYKKPNSIICIDIDNFGIYNILYGYKKADYLLSEIAKYLRNKYNQVYSIGGDIFAILTDEDPKELAFQLHQDILNFKTYINEYAINITATISYSTYEPILKTAMLTLDHLKKRGRNLIGKYDITVSTKLHNLTQYYLPLIKEGIDNKKIIPFFQPIIDYKKNKILYYEVLARIEDKNREIHPAFKFIEIAQMSGLINEITHIIVKKSFKIAAEKNIPLSINISLNDLEDEYFLDFIQNQLKINSLKSNLITFEILEDSISIESNRSFDTIEKLKNMGFKFAIDDFGAKYSNFERIHKINADYIKIDGKYIKDIDINQKSYEITKAIANFAKSIGVDIVAEFVSSKKIVDILLELGIDHMQGYYFAKPSKEIKESL